MSAVAAVPAPMTDERDLAIPFDRLVRTELRKTYDTRASRWLLIAIAAITPIVIGVLVVALAPKELTFNKLVDFSSTPEKLLLPALGILSVTSEWSQRTGLVTFTLVPRRRRVLLAKCVAVLALGIAATAVMFAACAVGNVLGATLRAGNGSWSFGLSGFGGITLVMLIGLMEGTAFGMALLVTPAAVVVFYVLPNVWSAVFSTVPGLKSAEAWVDLSQATGNFYNDKMTGTGMLQLLVAFAIWVAVPGVIGVWRVGRTEVKSS
ncbi:ABC transporter permease [Flexivirga caeni]|uniref:ABC transporter permease n=1 Tax=Flexivirga caeni TaxID=2294115 RepID=A0A3M9LXB3_9MICO|nr:ABC transporter permease [Flexivirga caeni]RNI17941.1 ABC transporter permease [Flexivirga caeni]